MYIYVYINIVKSFETFGPYALFGSSTVGYLECLLKSGY